MFDLIVGNWPCFIVASAASAAIGISLFDRTNRVIWTTSYLLGGAGIFLGVVEFVIEITDLSEQFLDL